ncbi:Holliday junction resolvase RuvX [Paramaledivibacter caminithermalis]|jgi:putative Holliday junction resolvase|uniref:Putative pre-16S rRNA nuclease n=1 Tax=Paramaledivibacter caminithermalis (strain DSM 15212 / CIP 107654 / DViRD3) TaxID=1121301 RepID=A0A1M6JSX6_PARC5|nr:Holliday junction resolvase RuvX [Paramaledivibacter caminithermalis]SHJ49779.1 putative holliday junction resolvase [Paramaledivibacter caminithermalis DSM 15212]
MRLMGLDVGDKTIGVAVSDLLGLTAQGLETINRTGNKAAINRLRKIISEKEVKKIVVGLPKNMNGTLGPQGKKVLSFVEKLKNKVDIEIVLWDERLTTVAAERMLISADVSRKKRKKVIDKVAAVYILQGYLDSNRNS